MRGAVTVGLEGTVVMTGVPEMTAQAGISSVSWSTLGLDGSSEDQNTHFIIKCIWGPKNTTHTFHHIWGPEHTHFIIQSMWGL